MSNILQLGSNFLVLLLIGYASNAHIIRDLDINKLLAKYPKAKS